MADFNVNHITGKQGQQGTVLAGVTTVSSTGSMRIPSGPTEQRGGRGRGVIFGGSSSPTPYFNNINYITIATTGNSVDFGDASIINAFSSGMGSSTRGVFKLGRGNPTFTDQIDYVTFSSGGGASDFGTDTGRSRDSSASFADSTRGCWGGGTGDDDGSIEYITIATTGDSSDFGNLSSGRYMGGGAGGASPTRGFAFGGLSPKTPTAA